MGTEPHGSLSKIKRRTNCAKSGSGHFVLLRSGYQEIAKTFRNVPRSFGSNGEICSRPGSNAHRTAQTHSSGTAPVSQRTDDRDRKSEDRRQEKGIGQIFTGTIRVSLAAQFEPASLIWIPATAMR